jgi:tetratricopeptide (TPR) repeat protein
MPKKKATKSQPAAISTPQRLQERLEAVYRLIEQRNWVDAEEVLVDLDHRYPDQPEILGALAHVYSEQEHMQGFLYAIERLDTFTPQDAEIKLALIGAYVANGYLASGLSAVKQFLEKWPEHNEAGEAQRLQVELQQGLATTLQDWGLEAEESSGLGLEFEAVQILMDQSRFRQAITRAETLVKKNPRFRPLLNNLSVAYWMNGQTGKAIETASRALEIASNDYFALGNLAHFSFLSGKLDEARNYAELLKALPTRSVESALKTVEILSFLGDFDGVCTIYKEMEQGGWTDQLGSSAAYFHHLAANALAWQANEERARMIWMEALEMLPGFELAQVNLEDLQKPIQERNGPFAYSHHDWLSPKAQEDLDRAMSNLTRDDRQAIQRASRTWLGRHPEVLSLAPLMLQLGDALGREFILGLAQVVNHPELIAAVKDFAFGQAGCDEYRLTAANMAVQAGLLPTGMHRLWIDGEWTETLLFGIEVTESGKLTHSSKVDGWLRAALRSSKQGEFAQAESLLQQASTAEPDAPDLLYNLAVLYQRQGRLDESDALIDQISEKFPDFLLARVNRAQRAITGGDLHRANQLLEPLRLRTKMSENEFDAFCSAHIDLYLGEGKRSEAQAWFGVWESHNPQNNKLARYQELFRSM